MIAYQEPWNVFNEQPPNVNHFKEKSIKKMFKKNDGNTLNKEHFNPTARKS